MPSRRSARTSLPELRRRPARGRSPTSSGQHPRPPPTHFGPDTTCSSRCRRLPCRLPHRSRRRPSRPAAAPAPRESASATVQSVLAIAGAGLFAVAAIVFTFFNPDLTDHALRSAIVGAVTLVFLGGAWLLARRGLQFSAEAVGALGMVFVALDVYAISELAPPTINLWVFVALGTLVSAIIMIACACARSHPELAAHLARGAGGRSGDVRLRRRHALVDRVGSRRHRLRGASRTRVDTQAGGRASRSALRPEHITLVVAADRGDRRWPFRSCPTPMRRPRPHTG